MEAADSLIMTIVHDGPITEMTYVAVVAVRDLDNRPWIDVIINSDPIAPAAKTNRSPCRGLKGPVNNKAIESWSA
ncbi:hypothetical protein NPX13_g4874 [Xylaria arbuscula]|uniref:Uncharacterized protein n=1 Tax=Xylaria arbuscula TaxID=114810 RepID=A0A9W8TN77_9PEZI|nr:hypothetical protein NPX13_g4874 [Xylaria arbuscula]